MTAHRLPGSTRVSPDRAGRQRSDLRGPSRTAPPSRSAAEGSHSAFAFAWRGRAPASRRGASQSRSPDRPLDHAEPPRSPRPTGEPFGRRCTTGVDRTNITSVSPLKVTMCLAARRRSPRTRRPAPPKVMGSNSSSTDALDDLPAIVDSRLKCLVGRPDSASADGLPRVSMKPGANHTHGRP